METQIVKCPPFAETMIISDDADLACRLASLWAQPGHYLPIIEGPRLGRPDADNESIECTNAVRRASPKRLILAGLTQEAVSSLEPSLPSEPAVFVINKEDFEEILGSDMPRLVRSIDQPGLALLEAMRTKQILYNLENGECANQLPSVKGHVVVCETGHPMSEVVAASYAFALDAALVVIPQVDKEEAENLLEAFYGIYGYREASATQRFQDLCQELRRRCPGVTLSAGSSCTFISRSLPLSVGFPEVPTTNLFTYPRLGIAIINGFAAEQRGTRGINIAALVDPHTTDAPEVERAAFLLAERGMLVRGFRGQTATVRTISQMVENWPYDLLFIATHCGDVSGYRWTYEFTDSEGLARRLVVEIAIGIGQIDDSEMLDVTQFIRFKELDGVDWSNQAEKADLYVGTAITDFLKLTSQGENELEPVQKELVDRVSGSSALKMFDHNYIALPHALAGTNTPIIFNNACVSWHTLAEKFFVGNARAYVGTLVEVTPAEASEVAVKVFGKFFGKPIAHSVWSAQKVVYGDGARRPYVVSGVYPQRLRTTKQDNVRLLGEQLERGLAVWGKREADAAALGEELIVKKTRDLAKWHQSEIDGLRAFVRRSRKDAGNSDRRQPKR